MKYFGTLTALITLLMFPRDLMAWETDQHRNITQAAVDRASVDSPDIQRFSQLIIPWSGGTGDSKNLNLNDPLELLLSYVGASLPAEEMAHLVR